MITQERLKELLHYDPETGIFTWLVDKPPRAKKGQIAGYVGGGEDYVRISIDGKSYRGHRLAWFYMTGKWPALIDHIDCNRSNNRFANLRLASDSENQWNHKKAKSNKTGYKGVCRDYRSGKFRAVIGYKRKDIELGQYNTAEEAAKAYDKAALELHGEFAKLNFPTS